MELIFLGTSHGAAEKNRFCSSTCLKIKDACYLFDCGAPVEGLLKNRGIAPKNIKSTFITHMHEDHAGTLSFIAKIFAVYEKKASTKIYFPEENGVIAYKAWIDALHLNCYEESPYSRIDFQVVKNGMIYKDENIEVTAIETDHICGFPSYAYKVEACGRKLLFTGDLSTDFHDYPEIALQEDFDVIVCEITHFSLEHALQKIVNSRTKQLIFNHVYPGNEERCRESDFPFPVLIADDGTVYKLDE